MGVAATTRVAKNSQWGGYFRGLRAEPPAAKDWGLGDISPSCRRYGNLGTESPALENFTFFANNLILGLFKEIILF